MKVISKRNGNFTSSNIVALTTTGGGYDGFGAAAVTYIEERNFERKLGRKLTNESNARPLTWGKLCEPYVKDILGLDYEYHDQDNTLVHPQFNFWCGTPDVTKEEKNEITVGDIKCPMTLKSFCQLSEVETGEGLLTTKHKDGKKFFWQLVSNGILTGAKYAELIVFCPMQDELTAIRKSVRNMDNPDKYRWVEYAEENELPYLVKESIYNNVHIIRWEITQESKDELTNLVTKASCHLK